MTVSRLFTNPPCSGKGNREFNGALVEQTRVLRVGRRICQHGVCSHSSNTANRFRIRHSGRPVGDGMVNRSISLGDVACSSPRL
jgi:hypothetical protein